MKCGVDQPWSRGGVIYESLSGQGPKPGYALAWERDLSQEWDPEQWYSTMTRAYKGVLNVALIEASLKVITRWYLVPERLHQCFPSSSPLCFRDCSHRGSFLHVWWECPKIRGFWNRVFHLIRKVTGVPVAQSPHVALLNFAPAEASKSQKRLIHFMLLGAKLTIAKAWKSSTVSFTLLKRKISWIMTQEKLASSLLNTSQKFEITWEPWAKYTNTSLIF